MAFQYDNDVTNNNVGRLRGGDDDGDVAVRQRGGGDHPLASRRPRYLNPGTGC